MHGNKIQQQVYNAVKQMQNYNYYENNEIFSQLWLWGAGMGGS